MDVYVSYATKALKARGGNTNTAIFFILIIIKMLVIEKENIVIDVNKRESQSPESCWLVFDTTIQIN